MSTRPRRTTSHSESLDLGGARLVLDASCAINPWGTGSAESASPALPAAVLIEKHPFREVRRHPIKGRVHASELASLQRNGLLQAPSAGSGCATLRCGFPAEDPVRRVRMGQRQVFTPAPPARSTAGRLERSARQGVLPAVPAVGRGADPEA